MIENCKFCALSVAPEALVVGSVYVIPDAYPVTPDHILVIPLRHCSDYFDMTPNELADTHQALQQLRSKFVDEGVHGFNIGWNCGEAAGQTVRHAHCHFIPRRSGDMPDPTGGVRGVIPWRQRYTPAESTGRPRATAGRLGSVR